MNTNLTEEFLKHLKTMGITADNEPRSIFFQHIDGTIITIPLKQIQENQKIVDVLLKSYNSIEPSDVHEVDYSIAQELESIVKTATGKDIKEFSS